MNNQTAVEWLIEEIKKLNINYPIDKGIAPPKLLITFAFEKAKAIEREQIKESYKAGFNYRDTFNWECDAPWDTQADLKHNEQEFDKYYIETYKGGEQ